jgi:hypothetical protein
VNVITRRGTGTLLSVLPSPTTGTEISADEFCDSLAICYGIHPLGLQHTCDRCGESSSTRQTFSCEKCGLIIIRHNEVHNELCDMASKAFTPSAVHNEPKINLCCATKEGTCKPHTITEYRGNVLIHGSWEQCTDCILYIRVTYTDAKTYTDNEPHMVLEAADNIKIGSTYKRASLNNDTSHPSSCRYMDCYENSQGW